MESKSSIRERYDLIADWILMDNRFYETVLSLAPEGDNLSVLDVGTGQGHLLKRISKKYLNSTIYGVEFSKELVNRSNRIGCASCMMADALNIPLAEKSIDVVFCTEVIEHVLDLIRLLKQINRVLKPSGKLLITVPNRFGFYPAYAFLRRVSAGVRGGFLRRFSFWLIPYDDPAVSNQPVDHAYSSVEVLGWLRDAGFVVVDYCGYEFFVNLKAPRFFMNLTTPRVDALLNRVGELLGSFFSPIFAYNFFVVAESR